MAKARAHENNSAADRVRSESADEKHVPWKLTPRVRARIEISAMLPGRLAFERNRGDRGKFARAMQVGSQAARIAAGIAAPSPIEVRVIR